MIDIQLGPTEERILESLAEKVRQELAKSGIYNRVFTRLKSSQSIREKLSEKADEYKRTGKKMQDVFGIRVTVYFSDDENIAIELVKGILAERPESHSIDANATDKFGPRRCNLVFGIDQNLMRGSRLLTESLIDATVEIQFRTVLSEGWHEVEHDLRYKCKNDWENENSLERLLNGQLASLEATSWAMMKIFNDLAYKKYQAREWSSFLRNILRVRFIDSEVGSEINSFLTKNPDVAKEFLKRNRASLIRPLMRVSSFIPLKMDNVIFIINRYVLKNIDLGNLEPPLLKQILDESVSEIT